MENQVKMLIAISLIAGMTACKKSDCAPAADPAATETATDSIGATDDTVAAIQPIRQGKFVKKPEKKKLTQHQIDSIKTERGALITPPENVGPSLTPGSGKAVPSNNKPGAGTTANMGSSAKD